MHSRNELRDRKNDLSCIYDTTNNLFVDSMMEKKQCHGDKKCICENFPSKAGHTRSSFLA
jgi:hypothetical protein